MTNLLFVVVDVEKVAGQGLPHVGVVVLAALQTCVGVIVVVVVDPDAASISVASAVLEAGLRVDQAAEEDGGECDAQGQSGVHDAVRPESDQV